MSWQSTSIKFRKLLSCLIWKRIKGVLTGFKDVFYTKEKYFEIFDTSRINKLQDSLIEKNTLVVI